MTTRDWDARTYDRVADPMTRWGLDVLERLPLDGDERVMDAGCGTGRVTEQLAARLPNGHVIALDGSPAMVEAARARLARFGDRIDYVVADLGRPLPVDDPVDAVLSSSTFHWVIDHARLFGHTFEALRPGGSLVARCGGAGSLRDVLAAAASLGAVVDGRNTYAAPEDTRRHLEAAGFVDCWVWLEPEAVRFASRAELAGYLAVAALAPYDGGAASAQAVADRLPEPVADFVRLNILARRPTGP